MQTIRATNKMTAGGYVKRTTLSNRQRVMVCLAEKKKWEYTMDLSDDEYMTMDETDKKKNKNWDVSKYMSRMIDTALETSSKFNEDRDSINASRKESLDNLRASLREVSLKEREILSKELKKVMDMLGDFMDGKKA